MKILYSLLSIILSILFSFTRFVSDFAGQNISVKDSENIRLCFTAISDTHITDSAARTTMLEAALTDMSRRGAPVDLVVVAGDLTEHGEAEQFENFFKAFDNSCEIENLIFATGNHDTWNDSGIDVGIDCFIKGYNSLTGSSIEKAYYSTRVNGYTFIVLASEDDGTNAYISDEQISWLDSELAAADSGLPVFVVCHFPINGTNGQSVIWDEGGIGEQSDAVLSVLGKYENIFYISGHLHAGLSGKLTADKKGYQSVESDAGIHYVNLPCYTYLNMDAGNPLSGCGYIFEVYDDYVLLRARNFALSRWMACYDVRIDL